jgi:hypothetical protein
LPLPLIDPMLPTFRPPHGLGHSPFGLSCRAVLYNGPAFLIEAKENPAWPLPGATGVPGPKSSCHQENWGRADDTAAYDSWPYQIIKPEVPPVRQRLGAWAAIN